MIDFEEKRRALIAKKIELGEQIANTTDEKAARLLRTDYRDVCDKLELFYDDEPYKEVKK